MTMVLSLGEEHVLYEHFGYRVVGHASVPPRLETWGFFRPD